MLLNLLKKICENRKLGIDKFPVMAYNKYCQEGTEPPKERKVITMFHYFTLPEVYEYAAEMGYAHDDVEIVFHEEDGSYDVSFGHEYTEMWWWEFYDLDAPSTAYDHTVWED